MKTKQLQKLIEPNPMKKVPLLFSIILFLLAFSQTCCQKKEGLNDEKANNDLTAQSEYLEPAGVDLLSSKINTLQKKQPAPSGIEINVFRSTCISNGEFIEIEYYLQQINEEAYAGEFRVQWKDSKKEIIEMNSNHLNCVCGDTYVVEIYKGDSFLGQEFIETIPCKRKYQN